MRPSRFSEAEKLEALQEVSAGTPAVNICRKLGITQTTFYRWRSAHADRMVGDTRELRDLRDENETLKLLVANMMIEKHRSAEGGRVG